MLTDGPVGQLSTRTLIGQLIPNPTTTSLFGWIRFSNNADSTPVSLSWWLFFRLWLWGHHHSCRTIEYELLFERYLNSTDLPMTHKTVTVTGRIWGRSLDNHTLPAQPPGLAREGGSLCQSATVFFRDPLPTDDHFMSS